MGQLRLNHMTPAGLQASSSIGRKGSLVSVLHSDGLTLSVVRKTSFGVAQTRATFPFACGASRRTDLQRPVFESLHT